VGLTTAAAQTSRGSVKRSHSHSRTTLPARKIVLSKEYVRGLLVKEAAYLKYPLPEKEQTAALWLINKESSFKPYLVNPRSGASGLAGFLDSTWVNAGKRYQKYGITGKTWDYTIQIRAFILYVKNRYGTMCRAKSYHQRVGNY
jgi:hypothetical protein